MRPSNYETNLYNQFIFLIDPLKIVNDQFIIISDYLKIVNIHYANLIDMISL